MNREHEGRPDGPPRTRRPRRRGAALLLAMALATACDDGGAPATPGAAAGVVEGRAQALLPGSVVNYEGKEVTAAQIALFRWAMYWGTKATLLRDGGIVEWNDNLLEITEGRQSRYKNGKRTYFYSWCGDWVTYHLARAGSRHGLALNRTELHPWLDGMNLTHLRAWAGEPYSSGLAAMKARFKNDPSKGQSWHPWSTAKKATTDGYVPQPGDLVVIERTGGDHIEVFLEYEAGSLGSKIRCNAGAQAGGVAKEVVRDLATAKIIAFIDVSRLAPGL